VLMMPGAKTASGPVPMPEMYSVACTFAAAICNHDGTHALPRSKWCKGVITVHICPDV